MKFYLFIWIMCGFLPSITMFLMSMSKLNIRALLLFGLHSAMGPLYPVLSMIVIAYGPPPDDPEDTKK